MYVTIWIRSQENPGPLRFWENVLCKVKRFSIEGWRSSLDFQHLRAIMVELSGSGDNGNDFVRSTLQIVRESWSTGSMQVQDLADIISRDPANESQLTYAVTQTTHGGMTFFDYVKQNKLLISQSEKAWQPLPVHHNHRVLSACDGTTSTQLESNHESHIVAVQIPRNGIQSTETKFILCTQPQSVYSLFKRNGVMCANVFDSSISISPNAPCIALTQNNMSIVFVDRMPFHDSFPQQSPPLCPQTQFKSFQLNINSNVLKHPPYHLTQARTMIYYPRHMSESRVSQVLEFDGRFTAYKCLNSSETEDYDPIVGHLSVDCETEISVVSTRQNVFEERQEFLCPGCKQRRAEYYLPCGHIICQYCTLRYASEGAETDCIGVLCPLCRRPTAQAYKRFLVDEEFESCCVNCGNKKGFVNECGHIICCCEASIEGRSRCGECNATLFSFMKIFYEI